MSDLFNQPAAPEPAKPAVQQLFVDEAGTPTLFRESGKVIVGTRSAAPVFSSSANWRWKIPPRWSAS